MNVSLFCIFLTHWLLQMKEFHQSRRSHRLVSVAVMGSKVPLYGSGASLSSTTGMPTLPVPLNLNFVMRSRANVLGNLVKHKYYKRIQCSITLDPKKLGALVSLKNSCTYDWIFMHMVEESVKELLGKKMIIFFINGFLWDMDGIDGDTAQNSEGKMIRTHLFFELCNEDKYHVGSVENCELWCEWSLHKDIFFCILY